ncbi:hypothetical protein CSA56_10815 [candidate division KSB3 bacterium]|uniref:protein-glutamate methylesterase n=1 Tax=candidate division KSB3 bacterium TaxID=2044937 RepID=A0A2G6KD63_9BACT|nr:MAG: hypothetical protein CSA56_10815 [candidate division KSB3 bacterium]
MKEIIKVLLVDDAIVIRILVGNTIAQDPDLELVGKAENGKVALEQIAALKPDVVLLDIEMPEMNGLEVLKALKEQGMPTKVIMFSTYTTVGAKHTFEALELGAADFVPKPSSSGFSEGFEKVRKELFAKIKFVGGRVDTASQKPLASPSRKSSALESGRYDVVMIEGGMGAPKTFMSILPQIPQNFPAGLIIFQTMFPGFSEQFVRRVNQNSQIELKGATDGDVVQPGQGLILFGNHYVATRKAGTDIQLAFREKDTAERYGSVPRILCESISRVYGSRAIGVLLAGAGERNLDGIQAMKSQGGFVIAEEASSLIGRQILEQFLAKELIDEIVPTYDVVPTLTKVLGLSG